jgi:hypothetical protein
VPTFLWECEDVLPWGTKPNSDSIYGLQKGINILRWRALEFIKA